MPTKTQLEDTLKELPESFTVEALMDKVLLIDKIERANQQSLNNESFSERELNEEMKKWFK